MLIFSNSLLKKYRCTIDWDKDELKLHHNGKDFTIPVTMHKVKNKFKVNCANITPDCDDFSTPDKVSQDSQNSQDLSKDNDVLKKMHEL